MTSTSPPVEFHYVDEAYETKMAAFEIDCNEGRGEPLACHHVGEFYAVVKDDHKRASKVYEENCLSKDFEASCFNLGKLFLSGKGVPQDDNVAEALFGKRFYPTPSKLN